MNSEEYAVRQLRIGDLRCRIESRRFGPREMRRTAFIAALYGLVVALSSMGDHSRFDGIIMFCGLLVVIFSLAEEHDAHMKTHLADVMELIKLTNEPRNET
jgi:hypothetical protein